MFLTPVWIVYHTPTSSEKIIQENTTISNSTVLAVNSGKAIKIL